MKCTAFKNAIENLTGIVSKQHRYIWMGISVLLSFTAARAQITVAPDTGQIGNTLSLKQAVDIAVKNNLLVNQADITAQTTRINLNQAWDYMLPTLNGNLQQAINNGRSVNPYTNSYVNSTVHFGSYSLNGNLTLFSGLQLQNQIRQYKFLYEADKLSLQQQKDNITLNVLVAYLQVLSSRDLLAIAMTQAEVDARQVGRLDTLNQAGALLLLSNFTDLKGQYAGDLANIATATNSLEQAKISLFNILNVPYKRDVEYDPNAFNLDIVDYNISADSIYEASLSAMPSIRANRMRVRSYEKALSAARGAYYPILSAFGSISTQYSDQAVTIEQVNPHSVNSQNQFVTVAGVTYPLVTNTFDEINHTIPFWDQFKNNKSTQFGLQLSIPILNYLRTRNTVKQAKLNLKGSQLTETNSRLVLQQQVETAYQNMMSTYKQYKAYIDQAAAYAESFRTTEIRFNEGVVNSDIYLLAKNKIDAANVNLSVQKYSYIFRIKVLDYYQGKLTW
jgi:outer membrane protein